MLVTDTNMRRESRSYFRHGIDNAANAAGQLDTPAPLLPTAA